MSLKLILDSLDGVDEATQKLYTEKDGKFHLNVEGLPDVSDYEDRINKMDAKISELLDEKKAADQKARDAQKAADQAAADKAAKDGDVDALNESWQKKLDDAVAEKDAIIAERETALDKATSRSAAMELATTLAVPGSADVLMPHIRGRLKTEIKDGEATVVVLDSNGKPSASTVKELGNEIANDKRFAPLIVGSNASGGGANGSGGGAANTKTVTRSEFDAMPQADRFAHTKEGGQVVDD